MEIKKEGDQWIANQKTAADYFGITTKQFQIWGYEPVRKKGRYVFYDVRAIQNDLDARQSDSDEELDLTAERARLAKEQADKTEMENKVRRGELVEVKTVRQAVGTAIQSTKTRLLAIPSQIARYLEGQTAQNIETQVYDAIYESLTGLSDQPFGDVEAAKKVNGKRVGRPRKKAKRRGKRTARKVAH